MARRRAVEAFGAVEPELVGLPRRPGQLEIEVDLIEPNPDQPRRAFDASALSGLMVSIKRYGVLQPVRVRPVGDRFQLIAGERRWRAARLAGLASIPAVVGEVDEREAFFQALVENVQREDLGAADRNRALHRVRELLELPSWEAVGEHLGLSRAHVYRLLAIEKLDHAIREDARLAELKESQVRALVRIREPLLQHRAFECVLAGEPVVMPTVNAPAPRTVEVSGPVGDLLHSLADHFHDVVKDAKDEQVRAARTSIERAIVVAQRRLAETT